ncbi:substrate-binding periplasmic protein [Aeromonas allosaccharophila]|uniref:substrate-binding periplasmic protein n=1 Tax=Aeromonas allosaccharophila TaxID=656 RepID=UPI003D1BEC72
MGWVDWQPFSYRNEQQQIRGLDVELLNAIFLRAGYQAKFSEMPWARVLHELKFGTVQLAMSANITAERQQYARFSHPYREEETVIVVRRQDAERWRGITTLEQLVDTPDFHIGVLKGFDYGNTFRKLMARPELQPRLQMRLRLEQLLKMLQGGRIQGFILDPNGLQEWQGQNEVQNKLHILLRIELTPVHLILSKESTTETQLQRINQAIDQLKQSPDYRQILDRYRFSPQHPSAPQHQ